MTLDGGIGNDTILGSDGDDKLIRRSYWLGLSDRSIVLIMASARG